MAETIIDWLKVKQNSSEPEEIIIDAEGLDDLSNVDTAELYMRPKDGGDKVVDGASLSVSEEGPLSSGEAGKVQLDPDGAHVDGDNAFKTEGDFVAYVKLTFTDQDDTYHPEGDDYLGVRVGESF